MAGSDPTLVVRIAANLEELKRNLAEGRGSIETTTASMERLANSFKGEKLIQAAHNVVAAVNQVGGATKLSEADQARANATVTKAIGLYERFGKEAPKAMHDLKSATQEAATPTQSWADKWLNVTNLFKGFLALQIVQYLRQLVTASLDWADGLALMHAKTELSYRDLQILEDISIDTGVSVQSMANAVQVLQLRLGDGTARKGIQELGVSFDALKALGPAEQLAAIGAKLAAIEDPTRRAFLAAAIFGKTWKEMLPVLKTNMEEAARGAKIVGDAQVEAADRAGDRWDLFVSNSKRNITSWLGSIIIAAEEAKKRMEEVDRMAHGGGRLDLPTLPGAPRNANGGPWTFAAPDPEVISRMKIAGRTLDEQKAAVERRSEAVEQWKRISKESLGVEYSWQASLALTHFQLDQDAVLESRVFTARAMAAVTSPNLVNVKGAYDFSGAGYETGLRNVTTLTDKLKGASGDATVAVDVLSEGFVRLAQISGGTMGKVAREIGTVITTMKIGEDAGRQMRAGFEQGGVAGYASLTVGALSAAAALDAATNSMSKAKNVASGAATGAKIGTGILPGWGTAIGAGVGALVGLWKSNTLESRTVSPMRDEFFKIAGGLDVLNPKVFELTGNLKLVDAIFAAKNADEYNAALQALRDTIQFSEKSMQVLVETTQRYGFTIEELGPAMQRQELDKTAQQLFKDWEVLTSAGLDHVIVLEKMSENVSTYIQNAVSMGVEVPEAMRPMLAEMVKSGKLLDAQGNAIADLEDSGISWTMTMSEGFKSLIKEVSKLTEAISRGLGLAIQNIPDGDFTVRGHIELPEDFPDDGFTRDDQLGFANGTRGRFLDFGTGTRVTLHGRERVQTETEVAQSASVSSSDTAALAAMTEELTRTIKRMPHLIAVSIRDSILQVN